MRFVFNLLIYHAPNAKFHLIVGVGETGAGCNAFGKPACVRKCCDVTCFFIGFYPKFIIFLSFKTKHNTAIERCTLNIELKMLVVDCYNLPRQRGWLLHIVGQVVTPFDIKKT